MTRGLYRKTEPGGVEWAWVEPSGPELIEEFKTRDTYDALGGEPPFDQLPTKAQYDAENP